jgi:hypothetical protein
MRKYIMEKRGTTLSGHAIGSPAADSKLDEGAGDFLGGDGAEPQDTPRARSRRGSYESESELDCSTTAQQILAKNVDSYYADNNGVDKLIGDIKVLKEIQPDTLDDDDLRAQVSERIEDLRAKLGEKAEELIAVGLSDLTYSPALTAHVDALRKCRDFLDAAGKESAAVGGGGGDGAEAYDFVGHIDEKVAAVSAKIVNLKIAEVESYSQGLDDLDVAGIQARRDAANAVDLHGLVGATGYVNDTDAGRFNDIKTRILGEIQVALDTKNAAEEAARQQLLADNRAAVAALIGDVQALITAYGAAAIPQTLTGLNDELQGVNTRLNAAGNRLALADLQDMHDASRTVWQARYQDEAEYAKLFLPYQNAYHLVSWLRHEFAINLSEDHQDYIDLYGHPSGHLTVLGGFLQSVAPDNTRTVQQKLIDLRDQTSLDLLAKVVLLEQRLQIVRLGKSLEYFTTFFPDGDATNPRPDKFTELADDLAAWCNVTDAAAAGFGADADDGGGAAADGGGGGGAGAYAAAGNAFNIQTIANLDNPSLNLGNQLSALLDSTRADALKELQGLARDLYAIALATRGKENNLDPLYSADYFNHALAAIANDNNQVIARQILQLGAKIHRAMKCKDFQPIIKEFDLLHAEADTFVAGNLNLLRTVFAELILKYGPILQQEVTSSLVQSEGAGVASKKISLWRLRELFFAAEKFHELCTDKEKYGAYNSGANDIADINNRYFGVAIPYAVIVANVRAGVNSSLHIVGKKMQAMVFQSSLLNLLLIAPLGRAVPVADLDRRVAHRTTTYLNRSPSPSGDGSSDGSELVEPLLLRGRGRRDAGSALSMQSPVAGGGSTDSSEDESFYPRTYRAAPAGRLGCLAKQVNQGAYYPTAWGIASVAAWVLLVHAADFMVNGVVNGFVPYSAVDHTDGFNNLHQYGESASVSNSVTDWAWGTEILAAANANVTVATHGHELACYHPNGTSYDAMGKIAGANNNVSQLSWVMTGNPGETVHCTLDHAAFFYVFGDAFNVNFDLTSRADGYCNVTYTNAAQKVQMLPVLASAVGTVIVNMANGTGVGLSCDGVWPAGPAVDGKNVTADSVLVVGNAEVQINAVPWSPSQDNSYLDVNFVDANGQKQNLYVLSNASNTTYNATYDVPAKFGSVVNTINHNASTNVTAQIVADETSFWHVGNTSMQVTPTAANNATVCSATVQNFAGNVVQTWWTNQSELAVTGDIGAPYSLVCAVPATHADFNGDAVYNYSGTLKYNSSVTYNVAAGNVSSGGGEPVMYDGGSLTLTPAAAGSCTVNTTNTTNQPVSTFVDATNSSVWSLIAAANTAIAAYCTGVVPTRPLPENSGVVGTVSSSEIGLASVSITSEAPAPAPHHPAPKPAPAPSHHPAPKAPAPSQHPAPAPEEKICVDVWRLDSLVCAPIANGETGQVVTGNPMGCFFFQDASKPKENIPKSKDCPSSNIPFDCTGGARSFAAQEDIACTYSDAGISVIMRPDNGMSGGNLRGARGVTGQALFSDNRTDNLALQGSSISQAV